MNLKPSRFVKIRVAVPRDRADEIRRVLAEFGAGRQGNYEECSGSHLQTGRFRPVAGANPAVGMIGQLEEVEEELIETLCESGLVSKVIKAVKQVHPYEEPAIDIVPRLEVE